MKNDIRQSFKHLEKKSHQTITIKLAVGSSRIENFKSRFYFRVQKVVPRLVFRVLFVHAFYQNIVPL